MSNIFNNMLGQSGALVSGGLGSGGLGSGGLGNVAVSSGEYQSKASRMSKKIFEGKIEVHKASNGYIVHIGTREGYEYETHIAASIKEVNEIIATQIVAFRLEDR